VVKDRPQWFQVKGRTGGCIMMTTVQGVRRGRMPMFQHIYEGIEYLNRWHILLECYECVQNRQRARGSARIGS